MQKKLYHCLYKNPEGDALVPTCRREVNGREDVFLFATSHLSKASAFAFSYHDAEVIVNGPIQGTEEEFIVICGGEKTLHKDRHIKIYEFSSAGFEEIKGTRQWVSTEPVPFDKTKTALETTDYKDLMAQGLQIFLMEEGAEELVAENFEKRYEHQSNESMLSDLLIKNRARWINREENIAVSNVLAARIDGLNADIPIAAL